MDLINEENYKKVVYIENLISKYLDDVKKIKETSEFTSNTNLVNNLINLNLNIVSYTISLNYFYTRASSKALADLRNGLSNLISDLNLVLNSLVLMTPRELIESPPVLDIDPEERFLIVKKLGYIIELIKELSKGDAKVNIFLEESYLKFIVFAKNIIDYKNLAKNLMPDSPYYRYQTKHLEKVLSLLEEGAFLLRTNYELKEYEEYAKQSLQYLEAGKVLATITSQKDEIEKFSKMHEVWSAKFNSDSTKRKR